MATSEHRQSSAEHHVQALFLTHASTMRGFIASLLPDPVLAEDVLHETFLTVTAKADTFTRGTNFPAWACTIARFKVLEARRRVARQECLLAPDVLEALATTEEAAAPDVRLSWLRECLQRLAPSARRALALQYEGGLKRAAIAREMGWRPNAVSVALSRARSTLRACIEQKQQQEGEPA